MKYALALILICSIAAFAGQAPVPVDLPKPSPAVTAAYQKAAVVTEMVKEAQDWLLLTQKKQKDALDSFTGLVNRECPGCRYNPGTNAYAKPAAKE